jgi:putative ATPase
MNPDESTLFGSKDFERPLAEKLRPAALDDFVGQDEIVGKGNLIGRMIESGNISSFIMWGPPGVGKTTLARIIANIADYHFKSLSAVLVGIQDVKKIMEEAKEILNYTGKKTILFIDEIHRFNKAQQDAFLPYVEQGSIVLIGATTENPSFSIIAPLLSRMRVITLKRLTDSEISMLLERAIDHYKKNEDLDIEIDEGNKDRIIKVSSGDARRCYGIIELTVELSRQKDEKKIKVTKELLEKVLIARLPAYDKKGDYHFDYISALHKSMRNSDVDARSEEHTSELQSP